MQIQELKESYPDLYKSVLEEGRVLGIEEGKKAGMEEGKKAGAAAETERVKAVKQVSMPGHEALIETLMFDGKTTGPEAAVQIVNAEKKKLEKKADDIKGDGKDLKVPTSQGEEGEAKKTMKREEFLKLDATKQREFLNAGGKVTD